MRRGSTVLGRIARHTFLALALSTSAAFAALPPPTGDFALASRTPAWDFYGYFGAFWQDVPGSNSDTFVVPLEFRAINPDDWEFIVDTSVGASEGHLGDFETGDTFIRVGKGFRPKSGFIDYLSFDIGGVAQGSDALTSGAQWSSQLRFQGGPTRLGFDVSFAYLGLDKNAGNGNSAFTSSLGVRSQIGRLHIGLDYITTQVNVDHLRSVDLVFMQRNYRGNSFYGLLQKGLSDANKFWYVGVGYELKLGF
jgi:hypothetical protein